MFGHKHSEDSINKMKLHRPDYHGKNNPRYKGESIKIEKWMKETGLCRGTYFRYKKLGKLEV